MFCTPTLAVDLPVASAERSGRNRRPVGSMKVQGNGNEDDRLGEAPGRSRLRRDAVVWAPDLVATIREEYAHVRGTGTEEGRCIQSQLRGRLDWHIVAQSTVREESD